MLSQPPTLALARCLPSQPTPETKAERSQWYRIIATALNFTHKTMCAAVLGGFGLQLLSWAQLAALLCLQVQ